jgi:hypothetical protein
MPSCRLVPFGLGRLSRATASDAAADHFSQTIARLSRAKIDCEDSWLDDKTRRRIDQSAPIPKPSSAHPRSRRILPGGPGRQNEVVQLCRQFPHPASVELQSFRRLNHRSGAGRAGPDACAGQSAADSEKVHGAAAT